MPRSVERLEDFLRGPVLIRRAFAAGRAIVRGEDDGRRRILPVPPTPVPPLASSQLPGVVLPPCQTPVRSGLPSDARGTAALRLRDQRTPARSRTTTNADATNPRFTSPPRPAGCRRRRCRPAGRRTSFCRRGSVISRECAQFPPSRARQPNTVTTSPTFIVTSALPAGAVEHARRVAFELPVDDVAFVVFHVEIEMAVRVGPLDVGDRSGQRDRLVGVVLGAERVVHQREQQERSTISTYCPFNSISSGMSFAGFGPASTSRTPRCRRLRVAQDLVDVRRHRAGRPANVARELRRGQRRVGEPRAVAAALAGVAVTLPAAVADETASCRSRRCPPASPVARARRRQ